MKRNIRILLLIISLSMAFPTLNAQEGLCINSIFKKYGHQKGVTMVELSKDMLKTHNITFYKSITFKDVDLYLAAINECLNEDRKSNNARKIQEVMEDGEILSAYYQLPSIQSKDREPLKRYILYKRGAKNKATLVYIEGYLSSDKLMEILFK